MFLDAVAMSYGGWLWKVDRACVSVMFLDAVAMSYGAGLWKVDGIVCRSCFRMQALIHIR